MTRNRHDVSTEPTSRLTEMIVSASSVDPPVTLASSSMLSFEAARTSVENTLGLLRSVDAKFLIIAFLNCREKGVD